MAICPTRWRGVRVMFVERPQKVSAMDEMMTPHRPAPLEERFAALGTVRQATFTWPADKPFPWSDAECAAFARGHMVYWPLSMDELITELPGRVELVDRHAAQWNA